jgi:ankyrin repeat protein
VSASDQRRRASSRTLREVTTHNLDKSSTRQAATIRKARPDAGSGHDSQQFALHQPNPTKQEIVGDKNIPQTNRRKNDKGGSSPSLPIQTRHLPDLEVESPAETDVALGTDLAPSSVAALPAAPLEEPSLTPVTVIVDRGRIESLGASLYEAAREGQLESVKSLIQRGANVNYKYRLEKTALHAAALNGHAHVIEYLTEQGAYPSATDKSGIQPLHEACEGGHLDAARILLRQGAHLETPLTEGCTPLHLAASKGHAAVIQLLLGAGARVNLTCNGLTPLHYAIMSEEKQAAKVKEAVKVLLEGGADISAEARGYGSPIQTARTQGGHSIIIKQLHDWQQRTPSRISAPMKEHRGKTAKRV